MSDEKFIIPEEYSNLLQPVREKQLELANEIVLTPAVYYEDISSVGAMDVAYTPEGEFACAGIVIVDFETLNVIEQKTEIFKPPIPYVPTFLYYRESPGYHKLLETVDNKPDVLIFDGNGILHPFGIGLASQMGLETNIPSFGVAKKLLLGSHKPLLGYRGFAEIDYQDKVVGAAFQSLKPPSKPVYVSPGHLINLNVCINILREFTIQQVYSSKLPLPLALVDKLTKESIQDGI